MIFGITLKHFTRLEKQGNKVRANFITAWLLKRTSSKQFRVKDIQDLTFDKFVDLETYVTNSNYIDFCTIFVRKYWFETIYINNMKSIMAEYGRQRDKLILENKYIFNPPQYGEAKQPTTGDGIRNDFVTEYGNYVILMDMVCKGDLSKYKEVENWKVRDFFFWANYLSGQRIIENIK